jgi:hypothetical protein
MSQLSDKIGSFTTIPNSVIQLWPIIGVDGMALFMYLRYRTNSDTELAFPSYTTICTETKLTRRRIALAIRALEAAGVLERKRRFSGSTMYTLKLPLVQQVDSISPAPELPLVQGVHTNKIDLNKTKLTKENPSRKREVKPQPPKPTPPPKAEPKPRNPTFDAIAFVCGPKDPELLKSYVKENGGWIAKVASNGASHYPPEKIKEWYSPEGWWYTVRCKGLPDVPRPTPESIKKTVDLAAEWDKQRNFRPSVDQMRQAEAERNARAKSAQLHSRGMR